MSEGERDFQTRGPESATEGAELKHKQETPRRGEESLTAEERVNVQIMEGVREKYPSAFESTTDKKDREILIVKNHEPLAAFLVFTREGVFTLSREDHKMMLQSHQGIDFTPFLDRAEDLGPNFGRQESGVAKPGLEEQISAGGIRSASKIGLQIDESRRQWLSEKLKKSQKFWEGRDQTTGLLTPEEIVAQL